MQINNSFAIFGGITATGYIAELPDGKILSEAFTSFRPVESDKTVHQKAIVTADTVFNSNN